MASTEQLEKWISKLPRVMLEDIAFEVIDRLMDTEEIRFDPDEEDLPNAPYWTASGVELGEDE